MASDYRVTSQSTKVGIGSDGVIELKQGYGSNPDAFWTNWLDRLAR